MQEEQYNEVYHEIIASGLLILNCSNSRVRAHLSNNYQSNKGGYPDTKATALLKIAFIKAQANSKGQSSNDKGADTVINKHSMEDKRIHNELQKEALDEEISLPEEQQEGISPSKD